MKNRISKNIPKKEIILLIFLIPLVGILIVSAYALSGSGYPNTFEIFNVISATITTATIWLGCYLIVTFLWRKFPWELNPLKHLLIEIILITLYVSCFGVLTYFIDKQYHIYPDTVNGPAVSDYLVTLLITYFITSLHEAAFFYKQWKINFSKSAKLEKDNIEAKYETLKSQINPHFLFNSLNSLTTIVDENKEAVNYIQNLSDFLRYVLKNRDRELVLVREEIMVLHKYISLQKSRFRDNLKIEFNIPEKYYHYSLPPLVLQMLVENSIKHNVISKDKPLTIKVFAEKESIIVENNLQKKSDVPSTQQGLKNIGDRMAFFTTREVKITENSTIFKVEIPLLIVEL